MCESDVAAKVKMLLTRCKRKAPVGSGEEETGKMRLGHGETKGQNPRIAAEKAILDSCNPAEQFGAPSQFSGRVQVLVWIEESLRAIK